MFVTSTEAPYLEFLSKHLVLIAIPASAVWFFAGRQYLAKGNRAGAFLWQTIAVLLLVAFCINMLLFGNKSWLSLAIAAAAIGAEIWIMKTWWQRGGSP